MQAKECVLYQYIYFDKILLQLRKLAYYLLYITCYIGGGKAVNKKDVKSNSQFSPKISSRCHTEHTCKTTHRPFPVRNIISLPSPLLILTSCHHLHNQLNNHLRKKDQIYRFLNEQKRYHYVLLS